MDYSRDEIFDLVERARHDYNDTYMSVIEKFNQKYIDEFKKYLEEKGEISERQIKRHVNNVDLFLNGYLTYRYENNVFTGYKSTGENFKYFMEYVQMSSVTYRQVKNSLKRFYLFMFETHYINKEEYDTSIVYLDD